MGWGKKSQLVKLDDQKGGCNYNPDITQLDITQSPNAMNVEFYNGRWRKRLGYRELNDTVSATAVGYSLEDFGTTSGTHKQVAHFGSSVYAMSNLDGTFTSIRSSVPLTRSFNAKVKTSLIQTYSDYSAPYYWNGSAAAMLVVSASAPGFKRAIEFQGFLMAMNTSTNKMRVYYEDINTMIGGTYNDYFTLTPAPNDDEITDSFIINGRLYCGTKYGIFRVSFVGGITVFSYQQVVNNIGVVENTAQVVTTKDYGQVAIFLGQDLRLYLFDGANVRHISDSFYKRNDYTDIALELIDSPYRNNCSSVFDPLFRVYRLCVTRKGEDENRFMMNVDIDTFSYYPFDNMTFHSLAICQDGSGQRFLVGASYAGQLQHMLTGNTDNGTAIDDYWESAQISKSDTSIQQGQEISMFFLPTSMGTVALYDKIDYVQHWRKIFDVPQYSTRDKFLGTSFLLGSSPLGSEHDVLMQCVMTPAAYNVFRMKLSSNSSTLPRWELLKVNVDQTVISSGRAEPQR